MINFRYRCIGVERKFNRIEIFFYQVFHVFQVFPVMMQDYTVITVSDVIFQSEILFDPMVKWGQVEVREILAQIISNWNILVTFRAPDDVLKEPDGVTTFDFLFDYIQEYIMINTRVEF